MINIYRISNLIVNMFLLFLVVRSCYELFTGGYDNNDITIIIMFFVVYEIVTSSYFLWHTRKFRVLDKREEVTIDSETRSLYVPLDFRFSTLTGISNIILGIMISASSINSMIVFPLLFGNFFGYIRLILLSLAISYGIMKFYYSFKILRRIKKKNE